MTNRTYTSEELKKIFTEQIEECIESIDGTYSINTVKMHKETALYLLEEAIYLEVIDVPEVNEITDKIYEKAQHRIDMLS